MDSTRIGSLASLKASSNGQPHAVSPAREIIREMAGYYKLLGEPTRLRLLVRLHRAPIFGVTEAAKELGVSQPALSKHLGLLMAAGWVECARYGKQNGYSLTARGRHILERMAFGLAHYYANPP